MADVTSTLNDNRAAINELIAAAEKSESSWTTPRAPRKWSPCQVVEHVAITLEEGANLVSGSPNKFPSIPGFLRPVMRGLFYNRILKKNAFQKAKTFKAFNPARGPATPADARPRLEAALARFDQECRTRADGGQKVTSGVFGTVTVESYAKFMELHTRHHRKQMPM